MKKNQDRIERMEQLLRKKLLPVTLNIIDDSEKHRGHAGAKDGRGHFSVQITAQAFNNKTPVEQHQMVYSALEEMMQTDIHALQIESKTVTSEDLTEAVTQALDSYKALDIRVLDVTELTNIMDTMVICTATSTRHAASMADKLVRAMRKIGIERSTSRKDRQTPAGF